MPDSQLVSCVQCPACLRLIELPEPVPYVPFHRRFRLARFYDESGDWRVSQWPPVPPHACEECDGDDELIGCPEAHQAGPLVIGFASDFPG